MAVVLVRQAREVLARVHDTDDRLTAQERQRAAAFRRDEDRQIFVAGRHLLRRCAARLVDVPMEELAVVQRCPLCHGPHGRPFLQGYPEVHLSLSHAGETVAAAAGPQPVGIDLERLDQPSAGPQVVARVLTRGEREAVQRDPDPHRAFLRQWVRKEALIKAGVAGLHTMSSIDLSSLSLSEGRWAFHVWRILDWSGGDVLGSLATTLDD
ncbi:4'-phosphopantetheinyl transferase family protein [Nonomuraea gerenzanensis]|uniref:4'-phosphopantetheinyl transferase n=1 Tax=Nonomuraea gerenzanensis TaxID=93944 RepID=A0A1M4EC56_9ACTN|nr:4'-phosphopantetheinyl transferase superfamily protein [Nonomuraea gerenzanensis]UBU18506.1 4'-phosphopantetheinyl transferase superfamily protein [Nonomuraea gerenzanensis]SBO96346.1 4'-phosphopantetheinyl transferase [Nonomuraea gerenzanensis]